MIKRIVALAVAGLVVSGIAVTGAVGKPARKKTTVTVNFTVTAASIGMQGSQSVYAGSVSDPNLGSGAVVYLISGGLAQTGTFTTWFSKGSVHGTFTVTVTPNADGTFTSSGTLTVTGGTAAYKGARGNLTNAGSIDKQHIAHPHITGKIKY